MPADPAATRRLIESLSTHLEEHLATWKSSLVDARRDIETLLNAVSEKIPAHAKPLFPESVVALILEDAMPAPPAPPPPPPPPPPKVVERVVPAPPSPADWTLVRGALSSVESARTQVDVLTRFITQASTHASRVALLVLRNDRITGWKAIGFDASGGRDESVRTIDLGAEVDPFAADVLRAQRSRVAAPPDESSALRTALGGRPPARALLVPMVIRDRLAGLVWADELPGEEGRLNEPAIEVLTFVTGLAVDLLAARKKIPSPTLTPTGESIEAFRPAMAAPAPAAPPAPDAMPAFEVVSASKPIRPPEIREAPRPVAPPEPLPAPASLSGIRPRPKDAEEQIRKLEESAARRRRAAASASAVPSPPSLTIPAPAAPAFPGPSAGPPHGIPPSATAAATIAVPSLGVPPPGPPSLVPTRPPSSLPPPLTQASTGDFTQAFEALRAAGAIAPGSQGPPTGATPMYVPDLPPAKPRPGAPVPPVSQVSPTAVRPISGFIPRSKLGTDANTRERQVDDARRLARLLISEIKLYNEKKVDDGRAASDLYERLKDDIDRSRQVYEERTPETIRKEKDFFQEELVRILADGRAEALGPMP
jgi:hypothetical protein